MRAKRQEVMSAATPYLVSAGWGRSDPLAIAPSTSHINPLDLSGGSASSYASCGSLWRQPLHLCILSIPLAAAPPPMHPINPSGGSPCIYASCGSLWRQSPPPTHPINPSVGSALRSTYKPGEPLLIQPDQSCASLWIEPYASCGPLKQLPCRCCSLLRSSCNRPCGVTARWCNRLST